jgi:RNA polymerase sigma-70 factor, ECF subfamily
VSLAAPSTTAVAKSPPGRANELDEVTLRRAQRGDEAACRVLVERYQRPVFALISRMLGPGRGGEVEDLAQETFLKVFQALSGFSPLGPARLSTWILTIASRRAVDALRKRAPATEPLERGAEVASPARADEAARRRLAAAAIQRAVGELSPELRAAFLLREYHGLEYAEIARALAIDLGTVKSRLSRARRAVRDALGEIDV